jgi:AraC-like DNA-binding protein
VSAPLTVEDIAYHLGYTAPGNFSRAFRNRTGTSPAEFRKHGAANVPALHGR